MYDHSHSDRPDQFTLSNPNTGPQVVSERGMFEAGHVMLSAMMPGQRNEGTNFGASDVTPEMLQIHVREAARTDKLRERYVQGKESVVEHWVFENLRGIQEFLDSSETEKEVYLPTRGNVVNAEIEQVFRETLPASLPAGLIENHTIPDLISQVAASKVRSVNYEHAGMAFTYALDMARELHEDKDGVQHNREASPPEVVAARYTFRKLF